MLMFNADELFERLGLTVRCEDCEHRNKYCGDVRCENGTWSQVCDVLDHMMLIDAEPVVRCKDCVYSETDDMGFYYCVHDIIGGYGAALDVDTFCSYGERKDNE